MNQEVPPEDMIFGSIVLAIFLVFIFLAGWALNRFKNARFTKAWAPLGPLIHGRVVEDGGGAATSWLTGTYRGKPVRASMTPGRNRYSGETGHRYNYFDAALLEVPGKHDWKVEYTTAILGFGSTGWQIQTEDKALESRLHASGIVSMIERFHPEAVAYNRREGTLLFSEDVTPRWVPTPERFQEELELLLRLAKVNEEVNPA